MRNKLYIYLRFHSTIYSTFKRLYMKYQYEVSSVFLLAIIAITVFCTPSHDALARTQQETTSSVSQLKFIGECSTPHNKKFKGTTIGGLSGIDYDSAKNVYYIISDDRSEINPARFYTAKVVMTENSLDSVQFIEVTTLLQPNGQPYPKTTQDPAHTPDPESIRYNPIENKLVWSSEGERIVNQNKVVLENPAVTIIQPNGAYVDTLVLPDNMHIQATLQGPRQNGAFEGLAFADTYHSLYVSVEEPLYEDGPVAGTGDSTAWTRIIKYDVATRKPVTQYAYKIEPVAYPAQPPGAFKINGVSEILSLGNNKLLTVERSASSGQLGCVIRLFIADIGKATDVSKTASLKEDPSFTPANKKLLLNMNDLGRYIDNVEGVTFGPTLKNGHKTLLFVVDNNFNFLERTQFLLFEVIP